MPLLAPELARSDEGMNQRSFESLAAAEARSFWFRSRNRLIAWALRSQLPGARSVLEVGCGTGFVLAGLRDLTPDLRLIGGEPSLEALRFARGRLPGVELIQLDARRIPMEEEFDVVGAFDVLEHLDEDTEALASMARAVRPGGGVMVTVPQHPSLWSANDEYGRHRRRYTRKELLAKLRRAGLEVRLVTSFVSLLLPLMWISRMRQRGPVEDCDPMAEYQMSPAVDAALERVMRLEFGLIARGVSLPAGGSLLAVAGRP